MSIEGEPQRGSLKETLLREKGTVLLESQQGRWGAFSDWKTYPCCSPTHKLVSSRIHCCPKEGRGLLH